MVPGIEQRHLVVRDGTRVGYQVRPGAGPDAPVVVLANGLGGTFEAFRHLYDALDGYRVLCWDYRGLYSSAAPADDRANTVGHQVDDLIELLDHEGVARAVHVGWSMGVQVNFEMVRRAPDRVAALMAINGTYGRPFRTVMSSRFVHHVIPVLLRMVKAQADLVGRAARVVAGSDALIAAMKRFGMVSDTLDMDAFRDVAAGFRTIDWRVYTDLLARLDEHDAEDVLERVDVPTSIVTGDRDIMTPPATAERMHRAIAGSRLVVIRGGTHYTPVEYPAIVRDELHRLLRRTAGWTAPSAAAATAATGA
ncbi:MAG: alpha/beta hydrolase [Kofleriaceae bacterium]|nr:alpha/beta hydrolase [Myxococcales bacterium]MCB9563815.1 alpha/beta hydrolase [Kofleriaceae bacterium]MCB9573568.1 alpha/beta hydrolase [Kofleriaceae bacterium]